MTDAGTILVVDDLPQNVRLLEAVLAPRGYASCRPTSGREALERVAAEPVDLVLLDILMPEMDGYEVCRALRADPATQLPARRDDHGERRPGEGRRDRGGRRRLHHQAVRPGRAARARRARCCGSSATTTRSRRRPPSSPRGTASSSSASASRSTQLERMGRLRRFLSPQLAELVVVLRRRVVPREPPARDHRRVLRPARLHRVRRDGRARGRDGRARRVPRRARRPRPPLRGHARAVHRRRPDGLLQRPARRARRARSARCGWPWRCATASAELAEGWRRQGYDLGFGVGIAQGYATLGRIGFEGRSDYAAIGSVTNLAARLCAEAERAADPRQPARLLGDRGHRRRRRGRRADAARLLAAGARLQRRRARRGAGRA